MVRVGGLIQTSGNASVRLRTKELLIIASSKFIFDLEVDELMWKHGLKVSLMAF